MANVLTDPGKFFEEKIGEEVGLKLPFIIVLIVGIIAAIPAVMMSTKMMELFPPELAPLMSISAIIAAIIVSIIALIAAFLMWLIYAGVFHFISALFEGSGSFKRTFEFVGYGFIPSIVSGIMGLGITAYVLPAIQFSFSIESLIENPELMQQTIANNPLMQASSVIGILFTLWSAIIWIFGIKHARNIPIRDAMITVGVPVGVCILYSTYTLAGA